jgi:hypothetical protein
MGTRGSAQLLLIADALQDPCLRQTVSNGMAQYQTTGSGSGSIVPAEISITSKVANDTIHSTRGRDDNQGVYEHYYVETLQIREHGKFIIPTAKTDADPSVVQLYAPYETRRVTWKAIKLGSKPQVPKSELSDKNWELIREQVSVMHVEPIADGAVLRYTVSGCYDYVCLKARTSQIASMQAAVPPWVSPQSASQSISPFLFSPNILESLGRIQRALITANPIGFIGTAISGGGIIPGVNG